MKLSESTAFRVRDMRRVDGGGIAVSWTDVESRADYENIVRSPARLVKSLRGLAWEGGLFVITRDAWGGWGVWIVSLDERERLRAIGAL